MTLHLLFLYGTPPYPYHSTEMLFRKLIPSGTAASCYSPCTGYLELYLSSFYNEIYKQQKMDFFLIPYLMLADGFLRAFAGKQCKTNINQMDVMRFPDGVRGKAMQRNRYDMIR